MTVDVRQAVLQGDAYSVDSGILASTAVSTNGMIFVRNGSSRPLVINRLVISARVEFNAQVLVGNIDETLSTLVTTGGAVNPRNLLVGPDAKPFEGAAFIQNAGGLTVVGGNPVAEVTVLNPGLPVNLIDRVAVTLQQGERVAVVIDNTAAATPEDVIATMWMFYS